jgi:hypothetical protein
VHVGYDRYTHDVRQPSKSSRGSEGRP